MNVNVDCAARDLLLDAAVTGHGFSAVGGVQLNDTYAHTEAVVKTVLKRTIRMVKM